MKKLATLEVVRILAAVLVVLYHTQLIFQQKTNVVPFYGIFSSGLRGVDLFFVLSGFIIAYVHGKDIGKPERLGNYAFNRISRIYPAVWIMTLLAAAVYFAGFGGADKADKLSFWSIFASTFLLPQTNEALVNATWTLKFELFFYFVFGLLILKGRVGVALLAIWQFTTLVLAIVFLFSPLPEELRFWGYYLNSLSLEFSVGLFCCWLIKRAEFVAAMQSAMRQWMLIVIGTVSFVGGLSVQKVIPFAGVPISLGSGAIITGLVLLEQSGRLKPPAFLIFLGSASYSIYIVNYSAITLLATVLTHISWLPMNNIIFMLAAICGVFAGLIFDQSVDKPIQRWLHHNVKPSLMKSRKLRAIFVTRPDGNRCRRNKC